MDRDKLKADLEQHRAEHAEAARMREAWQRRETALGKIVSGFEDLLEAAGPGAEHEPMPWATAPSDAVLLPVVPTPIGKISVSDTTLNDAIERALLAAGRGGATLEELWAYASNRGAKTSMTDTLRATQFAVANLRKKGTKIYRAKNGRYIHGSFIESAPEIIRASLEQLPH